MRFWAFWLGLVAMGTSVEASAIVCAPDRGQCLSCGFALLRPLSGRTVSPNHQIDIDVSCVEEADPVFPSLFTESGTLPSDWTPIGVSYLDWEGERTHQRYRRLGPSLPAGAEVTLGTIGPSACQMALVAGCTGGYTPSCAANTEVDCCSRVRDTTRTPLLTFQVGSDPPPEPSDAGAPIEPQSSDTDAGAAAPHVDTLPFALRCTRSISAQLYLDVGGASFDDAIVEIELDWSVPGSRSWRANWYAQPCLGQASRRFDATLLGHHTLMGTLENEVYSYEIRARTEAGPLLAPETGTLRVPEDCVESTALGSSWQNGSFSVFCNAFDPDHSEVLASELSETVSPGSCRVELPEEDVPLLVGDPPGLDPAPSVAPAQPAPSAVGPAVPTNPPPAPAPALGPTDSGESNGVCTLRAGAGRGGNGSAVSALAVVILLALGRARGTSKDA